MYMFYFRRFLFFSAILLFFFVFRGFLFLGHSDPLGYDTGLYAKYIDMAYTALPQLPFQISLPDWPWGLYMVTDFLRWIGFSQRQVLYGFYLILHAGIALLFYFYAQRRFGKGVGIATFFLFMLSISQLVFFWLFYYKNILALFLMLCAMLLMLKKSPLIPFFAVAIGAIHPLTAFVFFLFLFFKWIVQRDVYHRRILAFSILVYGLLFVWSPVPLIRFSALTLSFSSNLKFPGTFIDIKQYLFLAIYYLPFALWGAWISKNNKEIKPFLYLLGTLFLMSFVSPIIPNRVIPFLDLLVILFSGIGLQNLFQRGVIREYKILFFAWIVFLLVFFAKGISFLPPRVPQDEVNQIKAMRYFPHDALIIATHSYYAPWIYGFSGHKTVAPEMFENDMWNREQWEKFWHTPDQSKRHVLMREFPDVPLYVFVGSLFPYPNLSEDYFFKKVSDNVYRYGP